MGADRRWRLVFCVGMLCLLGTSAHGADTEDVFWESVVKGNAREEYELYLKQYPKGRYEQEARRMIEAMRKKVRAQQQAKKQKQARAEAAKGPIPAARRNEAPDVRMAPEADQNLPWYKR